MNEESSLVEMPLMSPPVTSGRKQKAASPRLVQYFSSISSLARKKDLVSTSEYKLFLHIHLFCALSRASQETKTFTDFHDFAKSESHSINRSLASSTAEV
jgi:hypothetical protein